jgi:signal transduction histidine kinase
VKIARPSGATLVTLVLLILLPALAVLQYRWVGQLSTAARERLQRNVWFAALQFREGFDSEIIRATVSLQVGRATAREGASERYSDRYNTWLNTAAHPQIVANVFVVDADDRQLRLRRWNPEIEALESTGWPRSLEALRSQFQRDLDDFMAGRLFDRRGSFRGEGPLVVAPFRNLIEPPANPPGPQTLTPVFGFTIVELNMPYIREQMLPELASRHFTHVEGDVYRVAVTAATDPTDVLYRSEPDAPIDPERADASVALFAVDNQPFGRPRLRGDGVGPRTLGTRLPGDPPLDGRVFGTADPGRWRLLVQHQSGSLEAAVANARQRNLAISFGVLLLLTVSVALLVAASRRAHRLAQQQMEFVAGVSHELRTPVAVIRSAAENLSHGVVDGSDRVKRYGQLVESEARRLGEMVERVLQYAGIESGLSTATRVTLSVTEVLEDAIEGALAMFRPGEVTIQRDFAQDLPPIAGDAAALRSALQNLIANAVKYGGADRWVGIKAEHVRHRRLSEVVITVSDHGGGIPTSELPHIFDPFFRGSDAVSRQIHGSGLGLSLVRQIAASHGGRVTVTTRAGVGSSFSIALPSEAAGQQPSAIASELQTSHS